MRDEHDEAADKLLAEVSARDKEAEPQAIGLHWDQKTGHVIVSHKHRLAINWEKVEIPVPVWLALSADIMKAQMMPFLQQMGYAPKTQDDA